MRVFTYPLIARFIYRYANIPVSLILVFYVFAALSAVSISSSNWITVVLNIVLVVVMNRYYFKSYKIFPYRIELESDGLLCSDFTFSSKQVKIRFEDIDNISGGIFSGVQTKPIKIHESRQNQTVAFSAHIRGHNELLTAILSKIKREKYEEILGKITEMAEEQKKKREAKKK